VSDGNHLNFDSHTSVENQIGIGMSIDVPDRFPTCLAANIRMFSQAIHEGINTLPAVTGESRRM
jgi:hypothetical protein